MIREIEIITCDSGDWEVIKVNNEIYYEGHSTPNDIWVELFEDLGVNVFKTNLSDEDMEYGKY